jgi:hypothetical protein
VTLAANFIRNDREAPSSGALPCYIYLSWRFHTPLTFHRCAARVFYDLPFCHGERFAKIRAHLTLLVMLMLSCQAFRGSVFMIGHRVDNKVCSSWIGLCVTLAHIIRICRSRQVTVTLQRAANRRSGTAQQEQACVGSS